MAQVIADIIEGVRLTESEGVVKSVDRAFIVHGFPTPGGVNVPEDPQTGTLNKDEIIKLTLQHGSLPQPGEAHPNFDFLFVTGRTARAMSPLVIMVTVTYGLPGGGRFDAPLGTPYIMSGGSSVEQVETQIHRRDQNANPNPGDRAGDQITVEHEGVKQGGEITPFEGRAVLNFGTAFASLTPWLLVANWVNTVNDSSSFFYSPGALARTWLITELNFELSDRESPFGWPIYEFSMTMRHNPDTWDPGVIFIDPTTGRPPEGLSAGTGYKQVIWHDERNFSNLFQ